MSAQGTSIIHFCHMLVYFAQSVHFHTHNQSNKQTNKQTNRQAYIWTDRTITLSFVYMRTWGKNACTTSILHCKYTHTHIITNDQNIKTHTPQLQDLTWLLMKGWCSVCFWFSVCVYGGTTICMRCSCKVLLSIIICARR